MTGPASPPAVARRQLGVADLHGLDVIGNEPPSGLSLTWCDPIDAALVLGSRQPSSTADADACAAAGVSIVRRRSGGGAVLIVPDQTIWVDIVAPHGVLPDDIRRSMQWVGECWAEAIGSIAPHLGLSVSVHQHGMLTSAWSSLVCFAGLGPGEVLLGGRKLVGLSQRRTRHGVRVQSMLYRSHPELDVRRLLAGWLPDEPLPPVATLEGAEPERVVMALAATVAVRLDRPG